MSLSNTEEHVNELRRNTSRNSFYRWYRAYERGGLEGIENHSRASRQHWHKILDSLRDQVLASDDHYGPSDVSAMLTDALQLTGLKQARVYHKARLLSDNGPCYISGELKR